MLKQLIWYQSTEKKKNLNKNSQKIRIFALSFLVFIFAQQIIWLPPWSLGYLHLRRRCLPFFFFCAAARAANENQYKQKMPAILVVAAQITLALSFMLSALFCFGLLAFLLCLVFTLRCLADKAPLLRRCLAAWLAGWSVLLVATAARHKRNRNTNKTTDSKEL